MCIRDRVHGVLERQVPDGEGLKLGVARAHAVFVLVVELGEARDVYKRQASGDQGRR